MNTNELLDYTWNEGSLGLKCLRRSCFYPFWLRLRKLGWRFSGCKVSWREKGNIAYIQTHWRFEKNNNAIILMASRFKYRLTIINKDGKGKLTKTCPTQLESGFLEVLNQDGKFLFIRRLGEQSPEITAWQNKWLRHVKNGGKWSERIKELGILPVFMPEALVKPRRKG